MLDLIFQLSGALLLSWNQITMSKTDIINSARTIIPTSKHLDHSSAVYVLKRYYLNIIGFSYLAIGYLFSFLDIYTFLQLERSEEHTSELQSRENLVCRLLLEKK